MFKKKKKNIYQFRHQLKESDTFSAVPAWNTSVQPQSIITAILPYQREKKMFLVLFYTSKLSKAGKSQVKTAEM